LWRVAILPRKKLSQSVKRLKRSNIRIDSTIETVGIYAIAF